MPFPLVKPGDKFKPSAALSNAVRAHLNRTNGFQSGSIITKNAQIIRIPIYNSTGTAFFAGQAVSIDLTGTIKGDCYPAVIYSDEKPCYGVCLSAIPAGGIGDCVLSGIAAVTITGTSADGNYATPQANGEFARSEYGIPIVNISGGTSAVVMLGNITSEAGGGTETGLVAAVSGSTASVSVSGSSPLPIVAGQNVTITGGLNGEVIISSTTSGGGMKFPNWNNSVINISPGTVYSYQEDTWLAGSVETSGIDMGRTIVYVLVKGIYFDLFQIPSNADSFYQQCAHVCLPVPANTNVSLRTYTGLYTGVYSGLKLYSTL